MGLARPSGIYVNCVISHYKIPGGVTQKTTKRKGNTMELFGKALALVLAGVAIVVIVGLIMSLPVMLLWNSCLVAAIPGVKEIGWLQAWGIMILSGLLFKSTTTSSSNS